jgi:hypothetical protein
VLTRIRRKQPKSSEFDIVNNPNNETIPANRNIKAIMNTDEGGGNLKEHSQQVRSCVVQMAQKIL